MTSRVWYQSFVHPAQQAPYIERLQGLLNEVAGPSARFEVHGLDPPDHSFHPLTEFRCASQVIGNSRVSSSAQPNARRAGSVRICTTGTRVLSEALRNVHLDRLLWLLSVFLVGLRSGREGVVGVRQAGL